VRPYGGVVVGADEHVRCKGKEGLAILPGDAGGPGELIRVMHGVDSFQKEG
jgi:hypothetical protein